MYREAKEYIFPVFCLSCDAEGRWVCDSCFSTITITPQLFCPVCHASSVAGNACVSCAPTSYIVNHIATVRYEDVGLIGKSIHIFKYQYAEEVMEVIDRIITIFVSEYRTFFHDIDFLIPIPLHKKRFAERGFNQATSIARVLSRELGIALRDTAVVRTRDTPHQARLDKEGRLQNVKEAFGVPDSEGIAQKRVLLVDDVLTTGATMQECAKVLLDHGASQVSAFTLARG